MPDPTTLHAFIEKLREKIKDDEPLLREARSRQLWVTAADIGASIDVRKDCTDELAEIEARLRALPRMHVISHIGPIIEADALDAILGPSGATGKEGERK